MVQVIRQNQVLEQVVNYGINLDATQGCVAAWTYLTNNGIRCDTIARVLASPEGRRPISSDIGTIAAPGS